MDEATSENLKPNEDIKPTKPEIINIKVQDQNGESHMFRIKKSTRLGKLMQAVCEARKVPLKTYLFFFDGERLDAEATAQSLGLNDGDQIDIFIHQMGGFCARGASNDSS